MRKIWVQMDRWNKKIATTAIEGGVEAVMLPEGFSNEIKKLGKIKTIAKDGDLKIDKDIVVYTIKDGKEEDEIAKLAKDKDVILKCKDWKIIPLENLIAKKVNIIFYVTNFDEAQTAFSVLEKGVDRIIVHTDDFLELKKILTTFAKEKNFTKLVEAEIVLTTSLGMGDRVCIDTCTAMNQGEGILTGNSSNALFLIHSESVSNPYVAPRPFRVNAGAVHAYTKTPDGKTKYLSELKAGDYVTITNYKGESYPAIVGRLKIEKRPLMLIKAIHNKKEINTILQNAETIRLVDVKGKPKSVINLKKGDKILVSIEKGARHFGHKIEETITEK